MGDREEYLLFSAVNDQGKSLDHETCERLFHCQATVTPIDEPPSEITARIAGEAKRHGQPATREHL